MAQLIVFDMEWNMGYSPKTFEYKGFSQNVRGEIIQIGAVKMDGQTICDTFSVIMRPRLFPRLHHHVAKVTGLTQKQVNAGVSIKEGLTRFIDWCGPDAVLGEWGQDDIPVLKQNLIMTGLSENWPAAFYDLQRIFCSQRPRKEGEGMTLESVVDRLEIEKTDAFHDALSDALYTAKVSQFINIKQGIENYETVTQQLQTLLMPADKARTGFAVWHNMLNGEAWFQNSEMRTVPCPVCGEPLGLDAENIWLRRGNNCLYSMGHCTAHGPAMIWLRRMRPDGLYYTFARATEPVGDAQTAKWQKEKRAAIERARRKKEKEAAEALERVKNAGR